MPGSRSIAVAAGLAAAALAILLVAGCSSGGTTTVDQQDSVAFAQRAVSEKFRNLPKVESVDCPGDVEAKEGTTFACTATLVNGQSVTLPIRVGAKSGNRVAVEGNPDVIDQANPIDALYGAANSPIKNVDCPSDVPATVGKTFDCTVSFQDGTAETVTWKIDSAPPNGRQHLQVVDVQKGQ
jgi:hypothetical protein